MLLLDRKMQQDDNARNKSYTSYQQYKECNKHR